MVLHTIAETQGQIAVTLRQINRLRKAWGLNRGKGDRAERALKKKSESQGHLIQVMPRLAFVGVHLFANWLDQQHTFEPVVAQLQQAVETYKHGIQTRTLPCCITASRRYGAAFKRCFSRPCWVSSASAG